MVQEARRLSSDWTRVNAIQSLKKYQAARLIYQDAGDLRNQALVSLEMGKVQEWTGDPSAALVSYERALSISRLSHDQPTEAAALNRLGFYYIERSNYDKAFDYGKQAQQLSSTIFDRSNEAYALLLLGTSKYSQREPSDANAYLQSSFEIFKVLHDRSAQAQVLETLGHVSHELGNSKQALQLLLDALELATQANDLAIKGRILNGIAISYSILGEKQEAVERYRESLAILERMGNSRQIAIAFAGLGFIYYTVAQNERSLNYYSRALSLYRSVGDREGESIVLGRMGKISEGLWDKKKAAMYYEQLAVVARELKDPILESYVLNWCGDVYASTNKRQALSFYEQALALSRKHSNPRVEAYTLNRLGYNHAFLGEIDAARKLYDTALERAQTMGDRELESLTLYNLAALERDHNGFAEARKLIERSLKIIESLTMDMGARELRASYFATVHQQYEFYIDVLMQLHQQDPSGGFGSLALEASERSRARSLVDMLRESGADIRKGVDQQLLAQEQNVRTKLRTAIQKRMMAFSGPHTKQEISDLQQEIVSLTTEYEQLAAEIRQRSPQYAALTQATSLTAQQIQAVLDEETIMVEYALGDRRSFAWTISRDSVESFELPERATLEKLARVVHEGLSKDSRDAIRPAGYAAAMQTLSRILLQPIANYRSKKRVVVVADGALQYIPFSTLELADDSADARLIAHYELVNLPSASALAVQRNALSDRKPAPRMLAIIADPVLGSDDSRLLNARSNRSSSTAHGPELALGRVLRDVELGDGLRGLRRLSLTETEAKALYSLIPPEQVLKALGFDANRNIVTGDGLANYRIVHFATHALLDNQIPEMSGIILSMFDRKGKHQDGFLQLYEIYNLKLSADLVVLSACQTALGKDIRGEGIVSLTRGFMHAGAPRVVASLWNVDDAATADLMAYFYRAMIVDRLTPAAALRAAQLRLSKEKRYQSPYFWAGFVLQGEWNEPNIFVAPN
ncbi:MAG TPA: CHAT domain-containing tetratricopeptide repeat protein [Pyrinomonadaceae bacterium]